MKVMIKLLVIFLVAIISTNASRSNNKLRWGATGGAYSKTCTNIKMYENNLIAICKNSQQDDVHTWIDLTKCIQNENGKFALGGGYQDSCTDLKLDGNLLTGNCKNAIGTVQAAKVNLDEVLGNFCGILKC